jgi:hypothetical protein
MTSAPVVPGRLADWLLSQKESFLSDLAAGRGKGWLVAVGNEAGGECFALLNDPLLRRLRRSLGPPNTPLLSR